MIFSPKQRFIKTPAAKVHVDLVVSEEFRAALESALLDYQQTLTATQSTENSGAFFQRIKGATDFVYHLLNLAEPPGKQPVDTKQNLNHNA